MSFLVLMSKLAFPGSGISGFGMHSWNKHSWQGVISNIENSTTDCGSFGETKRKEIKPAKSQETLYGIYVGIGPASQFSQQLPSAQHHLNDINQICVLTVRDFWFSEICFQVNWLILTSSALILLNFLAVLVLHSFSWCLFKQICWTHCTIIIFSVLLSFSQANLCLTLGSQDVQYGVAVVERKATLISADRDSAS